MPADAAPLKTALADVTQDYLWRGRLALSQPGRRAGYRFNLDPVLLSGFAHGNGHILDLGAGCGVVGLLLLAWGKAARVTAVEVQPDLAALAQHNAQVNGFSDRFTVLTGDLRQVALPQADAVMFNPPYYPANNFRACGNWGRDQGRREHNGGLWHFVRRAFDALAFGVGGEVSVIVPAARHAELCGYIAEVGAVVVRQRQVLPRQHAAAVHTLVAAARPRRSGCAVAPWSTPLVLHADATRDYTDEVRAWVDGPEVAACGQAADCGVKGLL